MVSKANKEGQSLVPVDLNQREREEFDRRVMEVVSTLAREYSLKNKLSLSLKGEREFVIQLITKAYHDGFSELDGKGELEDVVRKSVDLGLQIRNAFLARGAEMIKELNFQVVRGEMNRRTVDDLGIRTEIFKEAMVELKESRRLVNFPNLSAVLELGRERKRMIDIAVENLIPMKIVDKNGKPRELSSQHKAVILRGLVMAGVVFLERKGEVVLDPFFFDPDSLDLVIQVANGKSVDYMEKKSLQSAKILLSRNVIFEEKREAYEQMLVDFGYQGWRLVSNYFRSGKNSLSTNDPKYWTAIGGSFWGWLPIDPTSVGRRFIFDQSQLGVAREQGLPHLWSHGVELRGKIIPSVKDLAVANWVAGIDPTGSGVKAKDTVRMALAAWEKFEAIKGKHPEKIAKLEGQLEKIDTEFPPEENEALEDVLEFEGTTFISTSVMRLGATVGSLKRTISSYESIINNNVKLRVLLSDGQSIESDNRLISRFLKVRRDQLKYSIREVFENIEFQVGRLNQPNWFSFWSWVGSRRFQIRDVVDVDYFELDKERMVGILAEMNRNNKLPDYMNEYHHLLPSFLKAWRLKMIDDGKKNFRSTLARLVSLEQRLERSEDVDQELFDLVKFDLETGVSNTESFLELIAQQNGLHEEWGLVEKGLMVGASFERKKEVIELIRQKENWDEDPKVLGLQVLPVELSSKEELGKHAREYAEAIRMVGLYRKLPGVYFKVPTAADLPGLIESLKERPIANEIISVGGIERLSSHAEDFHTFLELFQKSTNNVFVPFEGSEGLMLSVFIKVTWSRLMVARAILDMDVVKERLKVLQENLERSKKISNSGRLGLRRSIIARQLDRLKQELDQAEDVFMSVMERYNLAIDPRGPLD